MASQRIATRRAIGTASLRSCSALPCNVSSLGGQSRGVAARPREATHEPRTDGIHGEHHDNRDGAGRVLRCRDRGVIARHDDVDLEAHQLGGEVGEPFGAPARQAPLDGDILALHIPELAQPLVKGARVSRCLPG